MGWLKVDDKFEEHEKVEPLSDAAHRLWCRAACWCRKRENAATNGYVPRRAVVRLCGGSSSKATRLAAELVDAKGEPCFGHEHGLWEPRDDGWQFHDWEDYQPNDEDENERREEIRRIKAEAGRSGGRASAEARRARFGTAQPKQPEARASKQPEAEPEAYAPKQTKQPRSPPPPPPPDLASNEARGLLRQTEPEPDLEPDTRVPCPGPDQALSESQIRTLETSMMVPRWAIDVMLTEWCLDRQARGDRHTLRAWRTFAAKDLRLRWNDPAHRPKKPDDPDAKRRAGVEARRRYDEENARFERENDERLRRLAAERGQQGTKPDRQNVLEGIGGPD